MDAASRDSSVSDAPSPDAGDAVTPDATAVDSSAPDGAPDGAGDDATTDAAPPDDGGDASNAPSDAASQGDGAIVCPTDGGIPNDLACTGLYSDWATKTISTDALAYTPSFLLWSDGAQKSRWISLPTGTQIDTTDMDEWVFPVGTKIWKEFALAGQVVETRLLWKANPSYWTELVYRWSSDGSSATRLDDGETNVNGTTYEIPSTTQCDSCHAGRADRVLAFDLVGLGAPGGAGVRLADLASKGLLTHAPPATSVAIPEDSTGKAAQALGYLHVNCGVTCHNPVGLAQFTGLYMKLLAGQMYPDGGAGKVNELDTYTTAVNQTAIDQPNGVTYMRIKPGDAANSLLPIMALTRAPDAGVFSPMPPIISHQPDTTGVAAVQAWINALAPDAGP